MLVLMASCSSNKEPKEDKRHCVEAIIYYDLYKAALMGNDYSRDDLKRDFKICDRNFFD